VTVASPTSQQETQKSEDLEREKECNELVTIITHLILGSELRRFWKERTAAFRHSIIAFANEQHGITKQLTGTWDTITTTF